VGLFFSGWENLFTAGKKKNIGFSCDSGADAPGKFFSEWPLNFPKQVGRGAGGEPFLFISSGHQT